MSFSNEIWQQNGIVKIHWEPFMIFLSWTIHVLISSSIIGRRAFKFIHNVMALNKLNLFLKNHWASFTQTWHKTSSDDGNLVRLNEMLCPFYREDIIIVSFDQPVSINKINMFKLVYFRENFKLFFGWAMWPMGLLFGQGTKLPKVIFSRFSSLVKELVKRMLTHY